MKGTISLSWGPYGGFYWHWGFAARICLGWFALTYIPEEIDDLYFAWADEKVKRREKAS